MVQQKKQFFLFIVRVRMYYVSCTRIKYSNIEIFLMHDPLTFATVQQKMRNLLGQCPTFFDPRPKQLFISTIRDGLLSYQH